MKKYHCDYCNKKIQETRKQHCRSDSHKKNKDLYFSQFPPPSTVSPSPWRFIQSSEEHLYLTHLSQTTLKSLYRRFQTPSIPPNSLK